MKNLLPSKQKCAFILPPLFLFLSLFSQFPDLRDSILNKYPSVLIQRLTDTLLREGKLWVILFETSPPPMVQLQLNNFPSLASLMIGKTFIYPAYKKKLAQKIDLEILKNTLEIRRQANLAIGNILSNLYRITLNKKIRDKVAQKIQILSFLIDYYLRLPSDGKMMDVTENFTKIITFQNELNNAKAYIKALEIEEGKIIKYLSELLDISEKSVLSFVPQDFYLDTNLELINQRWDSLPVIQKNKIDIDIKSLEKKISMYATYPEITIGTGFMLMYPEFTKQTRMVPLSASISVSLPFLQKKKYKSYQSMKEIEIEMAKRELEKTLREVKSEVVQVKGEISYLLETLHPLYLTEKNFTHIKDLYARKGEPIPAATYQIEIINTQIQLLSLIYDIKNKEINLKTLLNMWL